MGAASGIHILTTEEALMKREQHSQSLKVSKAAGLPLAPSCCLTLKLLFILHEMLTHLGVSLKWRNPGALQGQSGLAQAGGQVMLRLTRKTLSSSMATQPGLSAFPVVPQKQSLRQRFRSI